MIGFVAMMFGFVQILCVCPAQAASLSITSAISQIVVADEFEHHSGDAIEKHEDGHSHDGDDCGHCSGDVALPGSGDGASAFKTVGSSEDVTASIIALAAPITPANLALTALDGLRWLDPPQPTLVSQKILLLI